MESDTNRTYTVEEKQLNNKMLIGSRKNEVDFKKSINNKKQKLLGKKLLTLSKNSYSEIPSRQDKKNNQMTVLFSFLCFMKEDNRGTKSFYGPEI